MSSILIYNVTVWQWNVVSTDYTVSGGDLGCSVPNSFVTVNNGFITKVSSQGEDVPNFEDFGTVIDGHGRLLLPGLIGTVSFVLVYRG